MQAVWTPNRPWGHEAFQDDDGKMYRRKRHAEQRFDKEIPTLYGPIRLRRMTRREVRSLDVPVVRKRVKR